MVRAQQPALSQLHKTYVVARPQRLPFVDDHSIQLISCLSLTPAVPPDVDFLQNSHFGNIFLQSGIEPFDGDNQYLWLTYNVMFPPSQQRFAFGTWIVIVAQIQPFYFEKGIQQVALPRSSRIGQLLPIVDIYLLAAVFDLVIFLSSFFNSQPDIIGQVDAQSDFLALVALNLVEEVKPEDSLNGG